MEIGAGPDQPVGIWLPAREDYRAGVFLGQHLGDRGADARAAAGHDDGLAV